MISPSLLVLRAKDPDRMAEFYGAVGLVFKAERHGNGPRHLVCSLGDFVFEIYPIGSGAPTTATRLGFTVDSVERAMRSAMSHGGTVISPPDPQAERCRVVLCDPEGHRVELTERVAS